MRSDQMSELVMSNHEPVIGRSCQRRRLSTRWWRVATASCI